MRRKIAIILLAAAMMTGCGKTPHSGTGAQDVAVEAEASADVSRTAGEAEDKEETEDREETEVDVRPEAAHVSEESEAEPAILPIREPTAAPELSASREPTSAPEPSASREPAASQKPEAAPEPTPVPAHTCRWDGGSVTRTATCGSEGILTYTCTSCGKTRTESIAKTTHGSTVTVLAFGQQEPDCFWGAKYDVKCGTCGEYLDTTYREALGHAGNEGVVTCQPDCTGGGSIKYTCTRCGFEWSEVYSQVQPHTWVEGIKKETDWVNGGTKEVPYLYCSVCGKRQD